jgi:transcriptional regulator with XRE-family HTH domain
VSRPVAPTTEALGAAVAQLRARRGLRQRDLADASGLDTSYLSGIERGHRNPTWAMLVRICTALELPLSELVRIAEDLDLDAGVNPSAAQAGSSARAKSGGGGAKKKGRNEPRA